MVNSENVILGEDPSRPFSNVNNYSYTVGKPHFEKENRKFNQEDLYSKPIVSSLMFSTECPSPMDRIHVLVLSACSY